MINDSLVKLSREIMLKIRTKANSQTGFTEDQISNLYKSKNSIAMRTGYD